MVHKQGKGMTGLKHSEKTKQKMTESRIKRIREGNIISPMLGKHHTEKSKEKIGLTRKDKLIRGEIIHPMKGKHHSEKTINILKNKCGMKKENHPNWQGGITNEEYGENWTEDLKKKIRKRDEWKCQICNCKNKILDVHHIDYNKKNCDEDNLITLCHNCHCKTNFNPDRWRKYFGT